MKFFPPSPKSKKKKKKSQTLNILMLKYEVFGKQLQYLGKGQKGALLTFSFSNFMQSVVVVVVVFRSHQLIVVSKI